MVREIQDTGVVGSPQLDLGGDVSANEVWEAFLHCRYKAYLRLSGQHGTQCDYESMCHQLRANVKRVASDKLVAQNTMGEPLVNVTLTRSILVQGKPLILDARLPTELGLLRFDAVKKVEGASRIGGTHYIPLLFHGCPKARTEQRTLLDLCGLFLGNLQGRLPSKGVIYFGRECRSATVRLSTDARKVRSLIEDVGRLRSAPQPPPLILNDHCQMCEFRKQCHQQAVEQGNLSLLGGIGEKEVKTYARKGILTLTQLAFSNRTDRRFQRPNAEAYRKARKSSEALGRTDCSASPG